MSAARVTFADKAELQKLFHQEVNAIKSAINTNAGLLDTATASLVNKLDLAQLQTVLTGLRAYFVLTLAQLRDYEADGLPPFRLFRITGRAGDDVLVFSIGPHGLAAELAYTTPAGTDAGPYVPVTYDFAADTTNPRQSFDATAIITELADHNGRIATLESDLVDVEHEVTALDNRLTPLEDIFYSATLGTTADEKNTLAQRWITSTTGVRRTYNNGKTAFLAAVATLVAGETISLPVNGVLNLGVQSTDVAFPAGVTIKGNNCALSMVPGAGIKMLYFLNARVENVRFVLDPADTFFLATCLSAVNTDFVSCSTTAVQVFNYAATFQNSPTPASLLRFIDCKLTNTQIARSCTIEWRGTTSLTSVSTTATGQTITVLERRPDAVVRMVNGTAPDGAGNVVVTGGGGASTPAAIDYTVPLTHPGNTTLTAADLGRHHLFTGTGATLWAVTLPPVAGNGGKLISVQIAGAASGMWALQSAAGIDGAAERRLWALETATLFCDGTTWTKIGGRTIPLSAKIAGDGSGNYAFGSGSTNLLALPVLRTDASGGMHATTHALTCLRANVYTATASVLNRVSAAASEIDLFLAKNSSITDPDTLVSLASAPTVSAEALVQMAKTGTLPLVAGDFVSVKQYASVALTVDNRAGALAYIATLELTERPSW